MRLTSLGTALVIVGFAAGGAFAQGQPPGASPPAAGAQSGAYCLQGPAGGPRNCTFATMAACEAAKKGAADKCEPNSAATTGSGAPGSPGKPPASPSPSR